MLIPLNPFHTRVWIVLHFQFSFLFHLFCCCPLWTDGIASPFGSTHVLLSLLQLVPWVPRGDRQQMKALILTSARAKPWIFNLLWHYSVSLGLCLTVCLSGFFYFFIFCCFHQHPVHWPQFDLHPAERHYTWDHKPQVLSLPLRLCVAVCFCVCKPETPLRCSRASGVRSLCHMCGGGVDRRGSVIHWPSAFSKRLFCSHTLIVHCMKLIALLLKSSGCHLTTVSCAHRSMGSSIRHLVDI